MGCYTGIVLFIIPASPVYPDSQRSYPQFCKDLRPGWPEKRSGTLHGTDPHRSETERCRQINESGRYPYVSTPIYGMGKNKMGAFLQRRAERRGLPHRPGRSSGIKCGTVHVPDLPPGHGILLGANPQWEPSLLLMGAWIALNTASPRDARESSLSRILQGRTADKVLFGRCLGILRRAFEREAKRCQRSWNGLLKIQAGLCARDGNLRIECLPYQSAGRGYIDRTVSGALMATTNMQMQTFVTQADENTEGFDGYNGDLTGDVAATLGANWGCPPAETVSWPLLPTKGTRFVTYMMLRVL